MSVAGLTSRPPIKQQDSQFCGILGKNMQESTIIDNPDQ